MTCQPHPIHIAELGWPSKKQQRWDGSGCLILKKFKPHPCKMQIHHHRI